MFKNVSTTGIDIVAVSRTILDDEIAAIQRFEQLLKEKGVNYSLDHKKVLESELTKGESDNLEEIIQNNKFQYFIEAINNKDNDVLWIIRGGYGANIIAYKLLENPISIHDDVNSKVIVGYSDPTILGIYFTQKFDWVFIHASMPSGLKDLDVNNPTVTTTIDMLSHIQNGLKGNYNAQYELHHVSGSMKKSFDNIKIAGGNLSLINCSLQTDFSLDVKGKILFFEDIISYDKAYEFLRSFYQLLSTGLIKDAEAVIIGSITVREPESDISEMIKKMYEIVCKEILLQTEGSIPIFINENFGHGEINYPLPLNHDVDIHLVKLEKEDHENMQSKNNEKYLLKYCL
ncbi:hypothetical protein GUI12_01610 [Anaplasmataceae bacterium AB001_6]|nr:hypothetical protein GUI12_01610 [Anaplasmataceae bacterium AB001_6]